MATQEMKKETLALKCEEKCIIQARECKIKIIAEILSYSNRYCINMSSAAMHSLSGDASHQSVSVTTNTDSRSSYLLNQIWIYSTIVIVFLKREKKKKNSISAQNQAIEKIPTKKENKNEYLEVNRSIEK